MRATTLIHPYLLGELAPAFDQTVTVQRSYETIGDYGEIASSWENLAGHIDIPAAVDPVTTGGEIRGSPRTVVIGAWQILLMGLYPGVVAKDRLIWGSRILDIEWACSVQHDAYTFVSAREVR